MHVYSCIVYCMRSFHSIGFHIYDDSTRVDIVRDYNYVKATPSNITPQTKNDGEKSGREIGEKSGREIGEKSGREIGEKSGREIGEKSGREIGEKSGREIVSVYCITLPATNTYTYIIASRFGRKHTLQHNCR